MKRYKHWSFESITDNTAVWAIIYSYYTRVIFPGYSSDDYNKWVAWRKKLPFSS